MSYINENSPVVALPEFEIFETIPVQTSIESTVIEEKHPESQLNSGGHIEFVIKTAENEFIRVIDTVIQTKFRVHLRKTDNTAIADADWNKVSIINNAGDSMWGQIDISIGDAQTTRPLHTHPYKAYIHTILNCPTEAKNTFLKLRGFTEDDFTDAQIHKPNTERQNMIKWKSGSKNFGKICEFWTPLHCDLFQQSKNLVGGITVKVRLIPNRPEHFFITDDAKLIPTLHFEEVVLHVKQRTVNGDVAIGILRGLSLNTAKYPINRVEVRSHTIDRGTTSRNLDNIYVGTIPRRAYICFVNNEAFSGSYTKNPFFFHHYNIGSIACFVNSEMVGRKPYKPDYDADYFGREYYNLLKISGQYNNGIMTTITPEQFKKGYTIFAFDLTRDNSHGFLKSGYVDPPKTLSHLRLSLQFKTELTETISAIIYTEWDDMIQIDSLKNAIISND